MFLFNAQGKPLISPPPQARRPTFTKRKSTWRAEQPDGRPIASGEPLRTARGGLTATERALYDQVTRSL